MDGLLIIKIASMAGILKKQIYFIVEYLLTSCQAPKRGENKKQ